jgi:hypothetical protein
MNSSTKTEKKIRSRLSQIVTSFFSSIEDIVAILLEINA